MQNDDVSLLELDNNKVQLPEWIYKTATMFHSNRIDEFIRTSCMATSAAIRSLFAPEDKWYYVDNIPDTELYQVDFDDEHVITIYKGYVYQSYAFKHTISRIQYNPEKEYWEHITHNKKCYKNKKYKFIIKN